MSSQLQIQVTREQLPDRYKEILQQNPLLARTEVETKLIGWTDEEVRTLQLLLACASNASLTQRLLELERSLGASKVA